MRLTAVGTKNNAHEDSIWAVQWCHKKKSPSEVAAKDAKLSLLTGSVDETCIQWDVSPQWDHTASSIENAGGDSIITPAQTFTSQDLGVISLSVDAACEWAATSSLDCCVRIWNLNTHEQMATISMASPEAWQVAFSPAQSSMESRHLAVAAGERGGVDIYDATQQGKRVLNLQGPIPSADGTSGGKKNSLFALGVAYSPDGAKVACSHSDGQVVIYDLEAQRIMRTFVGHSKAVRSIAFTPDGKFLISACDDKTCNLYDITDKNPIGSLNGHGSSVLCVESFGDGNNCVTGSSDHKIKVWDIRHRTCIQTLSEHKDAVWDLSFEADNKLLASVSDDGSISVFRCNAAGE